MEVTVFRQIAPDRFELQLDGGEAFRVGINEVADFSLYTGRCLTEAEAEALVSAAALARTKERALRIISQRAMSERGLYDRLVRKGETERNAAAAVAWLVELHFLNDADYASALMRHCAAKGYGPRRARDELYRHKVPRELWDEALSELPEQDGRIDQLLRTRLRGATDRASIKKAADALLRRGFEWGEIRAALERCRFPAEDQEDEE